MATTGASETTDPTAIDTAAVDAEATETVTAETAAIDKPTVDSAASTETAEFEHTSGKTVRTLTEAFQETIRLKPNAVALRTPGDAQQLTWGEYGKRVESIAAGLAGLGVRHGDTVAIMLTNRPEFHLVDAAALHLGATPFSIYNTNSPEQIAYLFSNAENRVVITEMAFLDRILACDAVLDHIIVIDGTAEGTTSLADVEANPAADFDFEAAWTAVQPSDLATLIYTSGTTGPPKGVELTHGNVVAQLVGLGDSFDVGYEDRVISYLPAAHVADRVTSHYAGMVRGLQVTTVNDPREIAAALPDVHPTVFFGVPRVWQKVRAGIEAKLVCEPSPVKKRLAAWAFETGRRAARADLAGESRGWRLDIAHTLADALVLSKVREALGLDKVQIASSGAAATPVEVLEYFAGLGIRITEVWGLSETTGVTTTTDRNALKIGTVGKPIPGAEIKLGADGELWVRGPIIMRGYRNQPEKTAETVDPEGWLATGDIATVDRDGNVTIVDRKKELIITEAGKNISPTNIENAVKAATALVGPVVAIGEGRAYITALIVLDPEAVAAYAGSVGIAETDPAQLAHRAEVRDQLVAAIRTANTKLSRPEQIKRFTVLEQVWEPGGDELTPTMKLKRTPIAQKYRAQIDALYADTPGENVVNLG